jgi:hypothetical protein
MQTISQADAVLKTVAFLSEIGITAIGRQMATGFLDHVIIENGQIFYDPDNATVNDILHEAGHIAVLPSSVRNKANDNLDSLYDIMCKKANELFDIENPDSPESRAYLQCGETEATAWAWAAGKAIGLPEELIIGNDDYDNEGENIRLMLSLNSYYGINGLVAGNMAKSVRAYPEMLRWLQI